MDRIRKKRLMHKKRHLRIRGKVRGVPERPRLCVYRSLKHLYCQLVDDMDGRTLASASTLSTDLRGELSGLGRMEAAKVVGKRIAEKGLELGIKKVVFDRGGYKFHGRVKALAEAARESGLDF
jgi:large subunit ribosomal protein L18